MHPYEVMLIVSTAVEGEEALDGVLDRFQKVIVDGGGEVTSVDRWGKRRFAYEIGGQAEGTYIVMHFQADHAITTELDRVMKIADDIVLHLIVRVEEDRQTKATETDPEKVEAEEEPAETP